MLDGNCTFNVLVYADADSDVPLEWGDSDAKEVKNAEKVQLRSFSTNSHRIDTLVSYRYVGAYSYTLWKSKSDELTDLENSPFSSHFSYVLAIGLGVWSTRIEPVYLHMIFRWMWPCETTRTFNELFLHPNIQFGVDVSQDAIYVYIHCMMGSFGPQNSLFARHDLTLLHKQLFRHLRPTLSSYEETACLGQDMQDIVGFERLWT